MQTNYFPRVYIKLVHLAMKFFLHLNKCIFGFRYRLMLNKLFHGICSNFIRNSIALSVNIPSFRTKCSCRKCIQLDQTTVMGFGRFVVCSLQEVHINPFSASMLRPVPEDDRSIDYLSSGNFVICANCDPSERFRLIVRRFQLFSWFVSFGFFQSRAFVSQVLMTVND